MVITRKSSAKVVAPPEVITADDLMDIDSVHRSLVGEDSEEDEADLDQAAQEVHDIGGAMDIDMDDQPGMSQLLRHGRPP